MFDSPLLHETQQLSLLAERLRESGHHDAAIEALLLGLRLRPADPELRRRLDESFDDLARAEQHSLDTGLPLKQMRRRVIDAAHFLGLAHLYVEQQRHRDAVECLEVAKSFSDSNPGLYKLHGRLLLSTGDYESASAQLEIALLYNPFDRLTAGLLAQSESALSRYEAALKATIHSFILLRDSDREAARELRQRMQELADLLHWSKSSVQRIFRERQDYLRTCFERLRLHRQQFVEREKDDHDPAQTVGNTQEPLDGSGDRLRMASSLRACSAIDHLSDELIFRLSGIGEERMYNADEEILALESESKDLCFLLQGRAALEYPSAYGPIRFSDLPVHSLFGERNFVLDAKRYGHVVALEPCRVLHLDPSVLEQWIDDAPELGVQLYWCLWHELARKLRATNEKMRAFVSDAGMNYASPRLVEAARPRRAPEEISSADKIAVFREQGLNGREIDALAEFAKQLEYPKGSFVFREGDHGDEMYIIVSGRVIISKQMQGGGEEALGVLKRGEFFGEMSLLDGQPRSADARVDHEDTVLLRMSRSSVDRALTMDPRDSLRLMKQLSGLLARRSHEIDHKIVAWSIIAGQQQSSLQHLQIS